MKASGRLRIGDDWNAITIIALSQQNPLKAVAEFVENSIDAGARNITITRGRERGHHFLRIRDDGKGIPRDEQGQPDFRYVATHICDSIKRRLKSEGAQGLQGEFGIGLLSFWTVGEELLLTSTGADGRPYQMQMRKGDPAYRITPRQTLFDEGGTELTVRPLLPGLKNVSGEKIQWFLASELRDRIRQTGVQIRIIDRTSRSEHKVEPRAFEGRLLHELPKTPAGVYAELYLNRPASANVVALYRGGTRVLENIAELELFGQAPWTNGYLQGIIDVGYLNLTPGTRTGVIHDEALTRLAGEIMPIASALVSIIAEQQRAEEEQASREILRSIERALKEALLALPAEEYDWFNLREPRPSRNGDGTGAPEPAAMVIHDTDAATPTEATPQRQFFDFPGPLFSVRVSPASSVVAAGQTKRLRAVARDRAQRIVDDAVSFEWSIIEGEGRLENECVEIATFHAPAEPGLAKIRIVARQREVTCEAQGLITVAQELLPQGTAARESLQQGIPAYTFQRAPGELWRSRFDAEKNLIVVNSGHRDFVYASRNRAVKLRYISRLYAKELVLKNFPGLPPDQLIERLIELTLYTEENLK